MKKIMTLGALALGVCSAQAGTVPQIVAPSLTEVPVERHVKQPFSITLGGGLMHEQVTSYSKTDDKTLPSILYGGTLGFTWDLAKTRSLVHSLGCSVGVYRGSQSSSSFQRYNYGNTHPTSGFVSKTWVDAIPITASYNVKYDLTGSVSVFGGVRAGAMIRQTKLDRRDEVTGDWDGTEPDLQIWDGVSSTKVLPMCGIGLGVQAYVTSRVSVFLSYDFAWTFGDDCSTLYNNSGDNVGQWYLKATSRKHRFYGTLNVGATYSF